LQAQTDASQAQWFDDRQNYNAAAAQNEMIAGVLYGVGGAAAVGSILWFALDQQYKVVQYEPPFRVVMTPNGVQLEAKF